jgi:hypothetical protein
MKILHFFLLLWVIFALRDLDPDSDSKFGSGFNPDPDPKPCKVPYLRGSHRDVVYLG